MRLIPKNIAKSRECVAVVQAAEKMRHSYHCMTQFVNHMSDQFPNAPMDAAKLQSISYCMFHGLRNKQEMQPSQTFWEEIYEHMLCTVQRRPQIFCKTDRLDMLSSANVLCDALDQYMLMCVPTEEPESLWETTQQMNTTGHSTHNFATTEPIGPEEPTGPSEPTDLFDDSKSEEDSVIAIRIPGMR
jgi:hypothetical protein